MLFEKLQLGYVLPLVLRVLPSSMYIKIQYWRRFRRFPDLKNPKTFNEKLQWLKLYWRDERLPVCVNKYAVRKYVADLVGEKYLIPLLGYFEKGQDIDFKTLPERFVVKAIHGSGWNYIHEKGEVDVSKVISLVDKWCRNNFFWMGREWAYKKCYRGVVIEKFIDGGGGQPPNDYKFFCFNGSVEIVQVDSDRFNGHKRSLYDRDWNKLDVELEYRGDVQLIEKPVLFDEMMRLAQKLSAGFPFVRVDLYQVGGNIYFGELTFYPGKGVERFKPSSFDGLLGESLDISKIMHKT